ncbi:hypothetical protein F5Y16DRAFT_314769 [Xylariaceae sp. FL0255]|nr:hypothetical protein F5Y16DRAFT_314769 [Xylariaceae sp. FL0255]
MATPYDQGTWFNECEYLETQHINPQTASPLFNGRIPAEIRNQIYEYALTEYPDWITFPDAKAVLVCHSHDRAPPPATASPTIDPEQQVSKGINLSNTHPGRQGYNRLRRPSNGYGWVRYDNIEPMRLSIGLLQSCRRVYLETHSLPLSQTEHRFYCYKGPPSSARTDLSRFMAKLEAPASVPGLKQKDLIRSVRIFAQQYWLEDQRLQPLIGFSNLEHIRLTLRRSDWWYWESNQPLRINPFRGNCSGHFNIAIMRDVMMSRTGNVDFLPEAWGRVFSSFSKLKTLKIDFETSYEKRAEMDDIVTWAVKWRFPLSPGRHLSAEGQTVDKVSWRGFPYDFCDRCEVCNQPPFQNRHNPCVNCEETKLLCTLGYGPQLLVWTATWKPASDR